MATLDDSALREKAAECFLALEVGATDRLTRLRWRAWLAETAEHRRAFEACRESWDAAGTAAAPPLPATVEVAQDRYTGDVAVASLHLHPSAPKWPDEPPRRLAMPRSAWIGLAATIALGAIGLTQYHPAAPDKAPAAVVYETGRGEQRQLTLPDGSVITLGPQVRLEVRLEPARRVFDLKRGEAIFTAAHDPGRPFLVYAGAGWIKDIGTAFDVRSDPDNVTVTVLQGEVEVDGPGTAARGALRLSQNQQVSYGTVTGAVKTVDAAQATGWREGQIAYVNQPLEKVVSDLSRYSMKDIELMDPSVGALRYTGTVSIDELDHWAAGLARVYPVQIQLAGDRLLIAAKHKDR
jgi:transmembrane sensor